MARNNGKPSEAEWQARIKGKVIRFWDAADLTGLNGRVVADFHKPADFIVFTSAGMGLAEVKSSVSTTSFPYANIEKGQRAAATLASISGCGSSFNFYIHSLHLKQWFILTADEFVADIRAGIKSRKWSGLNRWA